MSQDALAKLAGLTTVYVGFIERGDNVPTLVALLRIARALDVDAAELVVDFSRSMLREMTFEE